jgi:hypothetical protein
MKRGFEEIPEFISFRRPLAGSDIGKIIPRHDWPGIKERAIEFEGIEISFKNPETGSLGSVIYYKGNFFISSRSGCSAEQAP